MNAKIKISNVSLEFDIKKTTLKEFFIRKKDISRLNVDGIHELSLEVVPGERVGVIGGNGAGKSTLMRLIAGVYKPTYGSVVTQGRLAPLIELGAGFNGEMDADENVIMNGVLMGASIKEVKDKINDVFDFAELNDYKKTPLKYFSTGMGMRLSFAIGTSIHPDILLLDEVFAGGDLGFLAKARRRMLSLIDVAKIVVLVSHDLNLIKEVCNRVIWIEKGRLVADGKPKDVCDQYLNRNAQL